MSTIKVANASQLNTALHRVHAGDTIELAGGNYGRLELKGVHFSGEVTITSASDSKPAVFAYMHATNVSNVTFDGVDFVTSAASGDGGKPFVVNQSDDITIRNAIFDGQTANGYGQAHGIWVVRSDHFTLENSTLRDFNVASYFEDQSDLVVRNNTLSNIAWDAMIVGGVHRALFEDNDIDLHVKKGTKHTDGIQFWNTGDNNPISDLVVRGNHIETHGTASHGIYAGNGLAATLGSAAAFRNVLIEDNTVISAQVSGIAVGETRGLTIRDNTILQDTAFRDSSVGRTPVIRVDKESSGVSITGNITHKEPVASGDNWAPAKSVPSGWTISKNKLVPIGTSLDKAETAAAGADTFRLDARASADDTTDRHEDARAATFAPVRETLPPSFDDHRFDDGHCLARFEPGLAEHFDAHPF